MCSTVFLRDWLVAKNQPEYFIFNELNFWNYALLTEVCFRSVPLEQETISPILCVRSFRSIPYYILVSLGKYPICSPFRSLFFVFKLGCSLCNWIASSSHTLFEARSTTCEGLKNDGASPRFLRHVNSILRPPNLKIGPRRLSQILGIPDEIRKVLPKPREEDETKTATEPKTWGSFQEITIDPRS